MNNLEHYLLEASIIISEARDMPIRTTLKLSTIEEVLFEDLESLYDAYADGIPHDVLCELHKSNKSVVHNLIYNG